MQHNPVAGPMAGFLSAAALLTMTTALAAQEPPKPLDPETLTVEKAIAPGPNVFTLDQSWMGSSRINVLGADDLAMKGNMGVGLTGQMALTADGKTLYAASDYPKRIVYGPQEAIVSEWDVATLTPRREIVISERMAMVEPQNVMLTLAPGEKFLLVQNATPATSVSLVDLAKGAQIAEIPTPGCWGILPVSETAFMTVCGDGSMKVYGYAADGSFTAPATGAGIFDVDTDALFTNAAKMGDDWLFASFGGNLYDVAIEGGKPVLKAKFSITAGIEGWAPGGSEVIGYHEATGVAFVLMHPDAAEGSHKNPAKEIWAIDVAKQKLLYRSAAHEEKTLAVSKSSPPVLFAASDDEGILYRYEVDPEAKSAAKLAGEATDMGNFVALVKTDK